MRMFVHKRAFTPLPSGRLTIFAVIGSRAIDAVDWVVLSNTLRSVRRRLEAGIARKQDALVAADEATVHGSNVVTSRLQGGAYESEKRGLQRQDVRALTVSESRRIARHLNVHSVIDEIHHVLCMCLRLHAATHVAERHQRITVLRYKPGDDRVERSLTRGDDVRAVGIQ